MSQTPVLRRCDNCKRYFDVDSMVTMDDGLHFCEPCAIEEEQKVSSYCGDPENPSIRGTGYHAKED